MKVAVLGVGSIGGWLAAALARAGHGPNLIARGETLAALRSGGLRITDKGVEQRFDLPAGSANDFGVQDIVLVALKSQQFAAALPQLQPLLGPDTAVVGTMNGIPWWFFENFSGPLENASLTSVDPDGAAVRLITAARSLGCVVHAAVRCIAPAHFAVGGVDKLIFGEPSGNPSERSRWLVEAFVRAGIRSELSPNIRFDVWTKLWGNMNMNPLSALTRSSTLRMLDDPDVAALCARMMGEMAAAGAQLGLRFSIEPRDRMAMTRKLGDFKPSMLQDLEAGRALEYAAQLGAVVEIARRLNTPAPCCEGVLGLTRLLSRSLNAP